jgi:hypothetical protein
MSGSADARHTARTDFPVFDATLFGTDKPDLASYGLIPIAIVDPHQLQDRRDDPGGHVPDVAHARSAMAQVVTPKGITVIDIEDWASPDGRPVTTDVSVRNYLATLAVLRAASPRMKFGYYSMVPTREYWDAIAGPSSARYRAWQRRNDAFQPVADTVDALFPSLYTFYPDPQGWVTYAKANLGEARRMAKGKPVYCFLWFQFHDSTASAFQLIPADYWRTELDTCRRYADGIVIWGGFTEPGGRFRALPWDGNAPWWKATLAFLRDNRLR